jgi:hypothetical protein
MDDEQQPGPGLLPFDGSRSEAEAKRAPALVSMKEGRVSSADGVGLLAHRRRVEGLLPARESPSAHELAVPDRP